MKKLLCLFLVSIFVCSVGCIDLKKETKYYDLEQDYIELKEYFNRKENSFFQYLKKDLGKDIADKDIPENQFVFPSVSIYSMSNLPADDYICRTESGLWGTSETVYMKKDSEEPILRYNIHEIWIYTDRWMMDDPALILTDKEIINALQTVRKEGTPTPQEKPPAISAEPYNQNTYCVLDLRQFSLIYGLTFVYTCHFDFNDPEHIQWICFDAKDDCLYSYDVTEILSDYYNEHKDILTSSSQNG